MEMHLPIFEWSPGKWRVLAVRSGNPADAYVCFFPICFETVWSERRNEFRNEIHTAGSLSWSESTGFICDPRWGETAISWAIENGFTTYGLCHGTERYKYSFGAVERQLKYLVIKTEPGANLNDLVESACAEDILTRTIRLIEAGRLEEAKTGCRQIRRLHRRRS